jgi:glycosyl transferase, family 25
MRAFVINLDRSPDRLAAFQEEASRCGFAFERLSGVDGRRLSPLEVDSLTNPRFRFQPVGPGELGVFASHRVAWRRATEKPDRWTAILEDDARLADDIVRVLSEIEKADPDVGIIRIETTMRRVIMDINPEVSLGNHAAYRMWSWHGGTAGYVIRDECAASLLAATERVSDPLDQLLFNPLSPLFGSLKPYQLVPAVVIQAAALDKETAGAAGTSTTGRKFETGNRRAFGVRHGARIDSYRLGLKLIERIKREFDKRAPGRSYRFVPFARAGS